jgi:hypothetical protein
MACHGDRARLLRMAVDAMAATLALESPAIAFYSSNHVAHFHDVSKS